MYVELKYVCLNFASFHILHARTLNDGTGTSNHRDLGKSILWVTYTIYDQLTNSVQNLPSIARLEIIYVYNHNIS